MKLKFLLCLIFITLILCQVTSFAFAQSKDRFAEVLREFTNIFKNTKVEHISESEIPGVYEIYIPKKDGGVQIIYYYPDKKLLIFGEIWSVNGTSLTGEKVTNYLLLKSNNSTEE